MALSSPLQGIGKVTTQGFIDKRMDDCWASSGETSLGSDLFGFDMYTVKGKDLIRIQSGYIENRLREKIVKLNSPMDLDIRNLYGKPLRPNTWYFLYIEWDEVGDSNPTFRVSDKLNEEPKRRHCRRIGALHTTMRRTIRKFTMVGSTLIWPCPR